MHMPNRFPFILPFIVIDRGKIVPEIDGQSGSLAKNSIPVAILLSTNERAFHAYAIVRKLICTDKSIGSSTATLLDFERMFFRSQGNPGA